MKWTIVFGWIICFLASCSLPKKDIKGSWKLVDYDLLPENEEDKRLLETLRNTIDDQPELVLFFTDSLMGRVTKAKDSTDAIPYVLFQDSISANNETKHYKLLDDNTLLVAQGKTLYWKFERVK